MIALDLISDLIPAVKTSDTGGQVLDWMDDFRISHMPIVNDSDFLGLVSDNDIYSVDLPEEAIGNHSLSLFSPFVFGHQHVFEVIELVNRMNLTVVPVLNKQKKYLGLIAMPDLLAQFAPMLSADQPGAILEFTMNMHDYSLTEMARIVEENNAKILTALVNGTEETTEVQVSLKLSTTDLSSIVRSFERYDYKLSGTYLESEDLDDMYQSRFDEFMRYLNT